MDRDDQRMSRVFIGLGSNLGDRRAMIRAGLEWLSSHPRIEVLSRSGIIETEPWGQAEQPAFLNAVAEIRTSLAPHPLLEQLKIAEGELGRNRRSPKWGPREIDLDILLYGDEVIDTPTLKIPHEHLPARGFVIEQLIELDEDLVHPELGLRVKDLGGVKITRL